MYYKFLNQDLLQYIIYSILSYKLRCYPRIYSPEKIRNNTRQQTRNFSRVFDIANQLRLSVRLMNERQSLHHS